MVSRKIWIAVALSLILTSPSCGGDSSSGSGKGKVVTIKGALKNVQGKKVAVGAKTKGGKNYKGKVDPKTKKFEVNVPKGEKVSLSMQVNGQTKPMKFVKHKGLANDGVQNDEVVEVFDTDALTKLDIDFGEIDLSDEDLIIGDEAGEDSIFEYMDFDGDGYEDFDDDSIDLDGDGKMDWEDDAVSYDFDGDGEDDWVDEGDNWDDFADDEGDWAGFYDSDDLCDLDGAECVVPDEYIDENGNPFEGEENPEDNNGGTDENSLNCDKACAKECGNDSNCFQECIAANCQID